MITREEVKKLLAKKRLSGHEAGRLFLEDSFLVARSKTGLLTEKEHRHMRSLVKTQEDIDIYNSYLDLYRRTEMALKEADTLALSAKASLLDSALIMKEHIDRRVSSWNRPHDLPVNTDDKSRLMVSLTVVMDYIKRYLRMFMAYRVRIEDFSRETGVDFSYDIRNGLNGVNYALEIYNFYADAPEVKRDKISLEKIKPDKATYKYLLQLMPQYLEKGATDGQEG